MSEKTRGGFPKPFRIDERAHRARSGLSKAIDSRGIVQGRDRPQGSAIAGRMLATVLGIAALAVPASAHASFLPPEVMASVATGVAWFVIIFVPIGAIVLFWLVHVLPEKIAHKRHHPQADAIHTLCLLSLAFGGLLWPLAWLWAFMKPVAYRSAYGTDKHENYYHHMGERALAGQLQQYELDHLREELDSMADKGSLSADLKVLRKALASAQASGAPAGTGTRAGAV